MHSDDNPQKIDSCEQKSWEKNYESHDYDNVFNVTLDKKVCENISKMLDNNVESVLIPGCGSQTFLQNHISENYPNITSIVCTDWSAKALAVAKNNTKSPKVTYYLEDSRNLSFLDKTFDAVLICNSILSASDEVNQKIFEECVRVLKHKGVFGGLFPTILSSVDISTTFPEFKHWLSDGTIQLSESKILEDKQSLNQILYTPLALRKKILSIGLELLDISIHFFDSEILLKESEKIYKIKSDLDCPVWELILKARKN